MAVSLRKITPEDAGCWLDGHYGWQNHYDIVNIAREYGFPHQRR
jgi:hypothetical protein